MLIALGFLCVLIVFGYINIAIFRRVTNYANLFLLLWCGSAALSAIGFYEFYVPPVEAYGYIFLMLSVFEVALLFAAATRSSSRKKIGVFTPKSSGRSYQFNNRMLTVISLLCACFMLPYAIIGIGQIMARGFYYLRIDSFGSKLYSTTIKLILINFIQPCILTIAAIGFYQFVNNRHLRAYLFITLINAVLYILIFANRWILMEIILIGGIILLERYGLNIKRIIFQNFKLVLIASILLTVIVIVTMSRQISGSKGFFYNVYSYFIGNIHLFGVAVDNSEAMLLSSEHYLYGSCLLSAPLTLLGYICDILGLDGLVEGGIELINQVVQKYYRVSPVTRMNNNFTMLYSFLRDGGILGIIVDTSVLSVWMYRFYEYRNRNFGRKIMYIFAYSILMFTTFEWFFGRLFVLMTLIAIRFITKWFVRPIRNASEDHCREGE